MAERRRPGDRVARSILALKDAALLDYFRRCDDVVVWLVGIAVAAIGLLIGFASLPAWLLKWCLLAWLACAASGALCRIALGPFSAAWDHWIRGLDSELRPDTGTRGADRTNDDSLDESDPEQVAGYLLALSWEWDFDFSALADLHVPPEQRRAAAFRAVRRALSADRAELEGLKGRAETVLPILEGGKGRTNSLSERKARLVRHGTVLVVLFWATVTLFLVALVLTGWSGYHLQAEPQAGGPAPATASPEP